GEHGMQESRNQVRRQDVARRRNAERRPGLLTFIMIGEQQGFPVNAVSVGIPRTQVFDCRHSLPPKGSASVFPPWQGTQPFSTVETVFVAVAHLHWVMTAPHEHLMTKCVPQEPKSSFGQIAIMPPGEAVPLDSRAGGRAPNGKHRAKD